jgi:uncharacterized OB-fold protein
MSMFSSRSWREYPQRYRLEASKFKKSGKVFFPPRRVDPTNGETEQETVKLPDTGKILTYTVIRTPGAAYKDGGPYALAIAELTDGTRLMAAVTDCDVEQVKIGMEVRLELRGVQKEGASGVISYGYKFVPKWY